MKYVDKRDTMIFNLYNHGGNLLIYHHVTFEVLLMLMSCSGLRFIPKLILFLLKNLKIREIASRTANLRDLKLITNNK